MSELSQFSYLRDMVIIHRSKEIRQYILNRLRNELFTLPVEQMPVTDNFTLLLKREEQCMPNVC